MSAQSSSSRKRANIVDCDSAKRGVWIVKVPRYLSDLWEANAGSDIGRLIVTQNAQGQDVKLKSRPGLIPPKPQEDTPAPPVPRKLPEEHTLFISNIKAQAMTILAEDKSGLNEEIHTRSGRLSLEGRVVKRAECRPEANTEFFKMKIAHIQSSLQPKRFVKQLDRAEVNFKPVNAHAEDVARVRQKKEGAKTVRGDRDVIRQALFHAFEKHQYYRLQDLQQLTQQPANYVKDILQEIAVYNAAPPHKSMWELKPEYRNYSINR